MHTGNIIGKRKIVYQGNAKGIWHQFDAFNLRQEKIWPTTGVYVVNSQYETPASSITPASGIISGDLLIFSNHKGTAQGISAVTPSGYTNVYDIVRTGSGGYQERQTLYYKIADGTESGVSINGITSSIIALAHLRWFKQPITSVSVQSLETDVAFTGTVTKTITVSNSTIPVVFFHNNRSFYRVPYYYTSSNYELPSSGNFDIGPGTFPGTNLDSYYNNPTNNPNISYGFNGIFMGVSLNGLKTFNYSGTPNIDVTVKGDGSFNMMGCGYLQIS